MDDDASMTDIAQQILDKYLVPDGPTRDIFLALGAASSAGTPAFDLIVAQRVFREMHEAIVEVYRPRSPLEAQLEYDRTRNELAARGVDIPEWVAAGDPEILDRWARWNSDNG